MKCSKCGKAVVPGTYVKENGKVFCFKCAPHRIGAKQKKSFFSRKKTDKISCPNCHTRFAYRKRKCPECGELNPVYEFHFWEFFFNVLVGLLIVYIPFFVIYIIKGLGPTLLILAGIFVGVFASAIALGILFYIGSFVRNAFSRD